MIGRLAPCNLPEEITEQKDKERVYSAVATLVPDQQRARDPYGPARYISDCRRLDLELRLVVRAIRRTVCRSIL